MSLKFKRDYRSKKTHLIQKYLYTAPHSDEIKSDFVEITDQNIIKEMKRKMQHHQFDITVYRFALPNTRPSSTQLTFTKNFVTQINKLIVDLQFIIFNSNQMERIISALSPSKIKVCNLIIL